MNNTRLTPAMQQYVDLKKKYPDFILNKELAFELLLSQNALEVTNNCPVMKFIVPLYLGKEGFVHPFCCYGNDVNCDLCGAWAVFHIAALMKTDPTFYFNYI